METYKGVLKELGQATAGSRFVRYSYIEIGEQMLKRVYTYSGLDGKIRLELGNPATLHLHGSTVVAITTQDGKTYCTEKCGLFRLLFVTGWFVFGIGAYINTGYFIAGLPPILIGSIFTYYIFKNNSGASIPNAIEIPK